MKVDTPTADWPPKYIAAFPTVRGAAFRVSAILSLLVWTGRWPRRLLLMALLLGAVLLGVLLYTATREPQVRLLYAALPLSVLVLGAIYGLVPGRLVREMYEERSVSRIVVENGTFLADLNGHYFKSAVSDVRRVRTYGAYAAIEFMDGRFLVVPTQWLPHRVVPARGQDRQPEGGA